jgi:hypothetical protein
MTYLLVAFAWIRQADLNPCLMPVFKMEFEPLVGGSNLPATTNNHKVLE